jgi:hypothetical protein
MTCRHSYDDPNCTRGGSRNNYSSYSTPTPTTPDSSNYDVLDAAEESGFLIMKVKYPNCNSCAFEGTKIMVFENVTLIAAIKWKKIDPHFRDLKKNLLYAKEAPSPIARFPGTDIGWQHAISYAKMLGNDKKPNSR